MKPAPIAVVNAKRLNNLVRRRRYMAILKIIESRFFSAGFLSPRQQVLVALLLLRPLGDTLVLFRSTPAITVRIPESVSFPLPGWTSSSGVLVDFRPRASRFAFPAPRRRSIPLSTYPVCVFFQSEATYRGSRVFCLTLQILR